MSAGPTMSVCGRSCVCVHLSMCVYTYACVHIHMYMCIDMCVYRYVRFWREEGLGGVHTNTPIIECAGEN